MPALFYAGQTDYIDVLNTLGGSYTLPTATTTVLGGVKVDGTSITITSGIISAASGAPAWSAITGKPTFATVATSGLYTDLTSIPTTFTPPIATTTVLGGVKVDGTSITITTGVISSTPTSWSAITGKPTFATVATSGLYTD